MNSCSLTIMWSAFAEVDPGSVLWYCRSVAEDMDNGSEQRELPRQGGSNRLTTAAVLSVFFVWLQNSRSAKDTARLTGISERTIKRWATLGRRSVGVPPFKELAEQVGTSKVLVLTAQDEALKSYKWSRRKAVAQTLQICEGLRKQVRDAVLSGDLKIKTPEDAAKVAQAVKQLEESMTTVAKSMNLIEGEEPAPKKASPEKPKQDDVKEMSEDELRKRAGADVVPMKEAG